MVTYSGNYGFLPPSHTHEILTYVERVISLGLDESFTLGEALDRSKFQVRTISEDPFVISEALALVRTNVKNLFESVHLESGGFIPEDFEEGDFDVVNEVSRQTIKTRSLSESFTLTDAATFAQIISRSLSESFTFGESLTRLLSKARALSESFSISEALTRLTSKLRPLPVAETFTITDNATAEQVKEKTLSESFTIDDLSLSSMFTLKFRNLAETFSISEALARINSKSRVPNTTETFTMTDTATADKAKQKNLAESFVISESLAMVRSKFRTLTESFTITELAERAKSTSKALTESISFTDSLADAVKTKFRTLSESFTLTDTVTRVKPVVKTLSESFTILESLAKTVTTFIRTWLVSGQSSDFLDKLDNLTKAYLTTNWSLASPAIGIDRTDELSIDNFVYDYHRTYYIQIVEGKAKVTNHEVRQNLYQFEQPMDFICSARRLKKGEAFDELNSIINELLRILGEYQQEAIFGVQGITFDSITPIEQERGDRTVWQKTLRVTLHYFKVDAR